MTDTAASVNANPVAAVPEIVNGDPVGTAVSALPPPPQPYKAKVSAIASVVFCGNFIFFA